MGPIGPLILDPRMHAILAQAGAAPAGPLPAALAARTNDWAIGTAAQTLAALLLGVVFLMTTKPALAGAILAMIAALVLGLLSGIPLWRATRLQRARGPEQVDGADPYLRTTFWTRRW
jgi:hypothetical protein